MIDKKLIQTDHKRGIYFSTLFTNTCEYYKIEIEDEDCIRKFDNSSEALIDLWKKKYVGKRVKGLLKNGRYNNDTLSWEETKEKYINEVGR